MSSGTSANAAGYHPARQAIRIFRLTKTFRQGRRTLPVFEDFSLNIGRGDVVSILGASGCGKTTLLNIVSGTEGFDSGRVSTNGCRIAYMFQTDLLLPWRTARRNALLTLEINGMQGDAEKLERLEYYFRRLDLEGFEDFYPTQLSGGMRQRVALIRALLHEPDVLLLDEPFSALDYLTKLSLETHVLHFARELERTVIFVTHDIHEAIAVGDRLIVLQGDPGNGQCSKIVYDRRIEFPTDVGGRDPVLVRQDPAFALHFKQVLTVARNES